MDPFKAVAATYENWFDTPLGSFVDQRELQALTTVLPEKKVNTVLEIGAGTGHIARLLTLYAQYVIAVEPSTAMRSEGQSRLTDLPVHWEDACAEQLPYADAQFEGAVIFTTLEFVEDPEQSLQEVLRVVRPGGWVILGYLPALSPWVALYRHKADQGAMPWAAARFYTGQEIEAWMGYPAEDSATAVYLAPAADAPYEAADQAGLRAGNSPALEVLRWRKS